MIARINGVTIIVSTNRLGTRENILRNFTLQSIENKELIVVLNSNQLDINEWVYEEEFATKIRVFQLDEDITLGECYNFAARKANYPLISIQDDDDIYSANYLEDAVENLLHYKVDILGKTTVFMYFPTNQLLGTFNDGNEDRWLLPNDRIGKRYLQGGTLLFKASIMKDVSFRNQNQETDRFFVEDGLNSGYNVYSTSKYNYAYCRREDSAHTWNIPNRLLLTLCKDVKLVEDVMQKIKQKRGN